MKIYEVLLETAIVLLCLSNRNKAAAWFASDTTENDLNLCNAKINDAGELEQNDDIHIQCTCVLKILDCGALQLEQLPSKITFPDGISVALFKDNKIVDIKDNTFYNGKDVIELDLSYNEIDFISQESFKGFLNLQRLLLNHNKLWNLPDKVFDGLFQLRVLEMSHNALKLLLPGIFEHTTELRELKLEANPLQVLQPRQFEHLGNLEFLDLESIMLHNVSDFLFSFTPKLKTLGLANNQLSHVPTKALKALKKLKSLDLSGNYIASIEPHSFQDLKNLTRLYLNRLPLLKDIKKYAFGNLTGLRELYCNDNYILEVIDGDAFASEADGEKLSLDIVYLRQNNLETLSHDLFRWKRSMELHLDGNPWNCDCRAEWIIHIELKNNFQRGIRCENPSNLRGLMLNTVSETDLSCDFTTAGKIFMICLGLFAALILVLLLMCFVYKRHQSVGLQKPYFRVSKKTDIDEVVYERSFMS